MPYNLRNNSVAVEKPAAVSPGRKRASSVKDATSPTKKPKVSIPPSPSKTSAPSSPKKPSTSPKKSSPVAPIAIPSSPSKKSAAASPKTTSPKKASLSKIPRPLSPRSKGFKRVIKQFQAVVSYNPDSNSNQSAKLTSKRQKVAHGRVAVTAQVAKRAVDEQLKSLGAHPIRRVATHHVGKGLSTTKISKKGKVHVKHGRKLSEKASKHIKKAVINEIKRIATHKPSEVVAKVHIARAKTAINAEVVKKAIVKQIKNKK